MLFRAAVSPAFHQGAVPPAARRAGPGSSPKPQTLQMAVQGNLPVQMEGKVQREEPVVRTSLMGRGWVGSASPDLGSGCLPGTEGHQPEKGATRNYWVLFSRSASWAVAELLNFSDPECPPVNGRGPPAPGLLWLCVDRQVGHHALPHPLQGRAATAAPTLDTVPRQPGHSGPSSVWGPGQPTAGCSYSSLRQVGTAGAPPPRDARPIHQRLQGWHCPWQTVGAQPMSLSASLSHQSPGAVHGL